MGALPHLTGNVEHADTTTVGRGCTFMAYLGLPCAYIQ
jgi:hypothetical protein